MDILLAGIRVVTASLSVPFFLKKGRRQVLLAQENSQSTDTDDIYRSSSENADNSNNAFNVNFNNANVNNNNKNNTSRVRAVCAFSENCKAVIYSYSGNSMNTRVCRIRAEQENFFFPLCSSASPLMNRIN